jgi:transposase-like protein
MLAAFARRQVSRRSETPSDVIALVVLWCLRYTLAPRDLPEVFPIRGIVFSHEAVRDSETKLMPAMAESLRRRRRGKACQELGRKSRLITTDARFRRWPAT